MEKYVQQFPGKATLAVSQSTAWFIIMESKLQPTTRYETSTMQALETRSSILFKGICLACRYKLGLIFTQNCHNLTRIFTPGINWG